MNAEARYGGLNFNSKKIKMFDLSCMLVNYITISKLLEYANMQQIL